MKRLLTFWLLLPLCLFGQWNFMDPNFRDLGYDEGLRYWAKADEGSGLTTADVRGAAPGFLAQGTTWAAGKFGSSWLFDGVNDYVYANSNAVQNSMTVLNQTPFTIMLWARAGVTNQAKYVMDKRNTQDEYAIIYGFNTFRYEFFTEIFTGTNPRTPLGGAGGMVTDTNTFHHVCFTYDGTTLRGYLDGVERTNRTISFALTPGVNNGMLRFGTSTGGVDFFNGGIDNVRIYGRALNSRDVAYFANNP